MQKNIKKILILIMLTNSTNQILAGDADEKAALQGKAAFLDAAAQVERADLEAFWKAFFEKLEPGTIAKKSGHKHTLTIARKKRVRRYDRSLAGGRQGNSFSRHSNGSKPK